jgi:hypothetical protein
MFGPWLLSKLRNSLRTASWYTSYPPIGESSIFKFLEGAGLPLSPTVKGKLCHSLFLEFEAEPE